MKIRESKGYENYLRDQDLANIFSIHQDKDLPEAHRVYNLNKSLTLKGLDDIPITSYEFYTVVQGDTWNLISYKIYGTVMLWWALLKANKIDNAVVDPEPGWVIKVLPKDVISTILTEMRRK